MDTIHAVRFTETNNADDSAGKTWGLEGNLFWYLIGGAFASVITLLLLFSMLRWPLTSALFPAAVPISLTLAYVLALRQGKPPGYDTDLLEYLIRGPGFGPTPTTTSQLDTNHV